MMLRFWLMAGSGNNDEHQKNPIRSTLWFDQGIMVSFLSEGSVTRRASSRRMQ